MSKALMNRVFAKDTFKVAAGTVTTGWLPGQFFSLDSTGMAVLATGDNALFMGVDDPTASLNSTLSLASPPTGSLLTGIYGCGSKVYIDHTVEVAASSTARAYEDNVAASGAPGNNLWVSANGKLTLSGSVPAAFGYPQGGVGVTGSVIAKLIQVPAAGNNYTIGVIFRI